MSSRLPTFFGKSANVGTHHRQRRLKFLPLQLGETGSGNPLRGVGIGPATVQQAAPHRTQPALKPSQPTALRGRNMLQKAEAPARLEHPQNFLQNRFHPIDRAEYQGSDHSIYAGVLHSQVLRQTSLQSDRPVGLSRHSTDIGMEMGIGLDAGPPHVPGQVGQIDAASGSNLHDLAGEPPPTGSACVRPSSARRDRSREPWPRRRPLLANCALRLDACGESSTAQRRAVW